MVKGLLNTVNRRLSHDDAGKLLLRLAVGGLMLFHGIHKLIDGVDGISGMLAAQGLPGFIAYGVLVGEVVAPCLLILSVRESVYLMSPERLFIVARDFPGGGALRLLRATKSHSAVAPVSGSATGDFDLRREPDRSADDRSRPAHSRRRFRRRSASWCW